MTHLLVYDEPVQIYAHVDGDWFSESAQGDAHDGDGVEAPV